MATNYFDGISLEDLQNFDPTNDQTSISVQSLEINTDDKNKTTVKDLNTGEEIKDDVDISFNIEEIANITLTPEEVEFKDKAKSKPASDDKSSSVTNSLLTTLASNLHKAGILSELTDEELTGIASEDKLYEAIQKQIKANEYSSLTEDQKLYLKAIENGIPEEDFVTNRRHANYFKNIDDDKLAENVQLQADLIYQGFLIKGFSQEEATEYAVSIVKNDSNAYAKALKSKEAIIKYNDEAINKAIREEETAKLNKATEDRKKVVELKSKIDTANELIPGLTINQTTKDKVFTSITKAVAVDESGLPMNEVLDKYIKDPDYKMKLHALHVLTKGFTDFSKLKAETKTTIVKSLKEEFNNLSNGSGSTSSSGIMTSEKIASMIPKF